MTPRHRTVSRICLFAACLSVSGSAQDQISTQEIWTLDQVGTSLRAFNPALDSTVIRTIPLVGSGQVRGFSFDATGVAFVCRGDEVRTYDGVATTLFAGVAAGLAQTQDVAVSPINGDVFISCGATASLSKIVRFDSGGTLLATLTDPLLNHPRRMAFDADGDKLYIACAGNSRILSLTPSTGAFLSEFDLTPNTVTPIGLSFDVVRTGFWITGDWGSAGGGIGFLQLPPATPTYFPVLATTATPGLSAPANVFFDRMRNLYVAGRSLNGGTAGVYAFSAATGNTLNFVKSVTGLGQQNIIDVRPRPEQVGLTAPTDPMDPAMLVLNASATSAINNALVIECPSSPSALYFAALSFRWPSSCAPYTPGLFTTLLEFPGTDPRGLPAEFDLVFRQTAGVCCLNAPPPLSAPGDVPLAPFLTVSGFGGFLNAAGSANAAVNFSAGIPISADGVVFSLVYVTIDPGISTGFGRVSDAFCLTLNVAP